MSHKESEYDVVSIVAWSSSWTIDRRQIESTIARQCACVWICTYGDECGQKEEKVVLEGGEKKCEVA